MPESLTAAELRRVQLGILVEVDQLCREHAITYYLAYGTLLGAVRHSGFIPWDDDVDVMMPREDYDRFVTVFGERGPDHLSVRGPGSVDRWPLPYVKVSDDRTQLWEPLADPVDLGVNVDVFPLDVLPAGRLARRAQALELRVLRWAVELHYIAPDHGRAWHSPFAIRVVKPLLRRIPVQRLVAAFERAARRGAGRGSEQVGVRVGGYDWAVPVSRLGRPSEVLFEGLPYLAPHDPHAVLTVMYGDYRQLPPPQEQVSHHTFTTAWRPGAA